MFVITADQIDSRHDRDRAGEMIAQLTADLGQEFSLPADQTSGDEIQILMPTAGAALTTILALARSGFWSVGLGIGSVRTPLPRATRQATGSAFIAARDAVTRAKKTDARFALSLPASVTAPLDQEEPDTEAFDTEAFGAGALDAGQVEALIAMLLLLRQRRSREGWEAADLLDQGLPQVEIAGILGISTAAVSQRVKNALWRVDEAARPALVRLLENLDRALIETDPAE